MEDVWKRLTTRSPNDIRQRWHRNANWYDEEEAFAGSAFEITVESQSNVPAIPPTGTHKEMALGTLIAGSAHSSAILEIMPIAEKV